MKKDAYYFPHFCNARHDRKLKRVQKELGIEGYGIYFMLLETLREQDGFKYPLEDLDLLADEFGTSEQKVRTVVSNYKLFLVDNKNNFTSPKLIEYLTPYLERSKRARDAANERWSRVKKIEDKTDGAQVYIIECYGNGERFIKIGSTTQTIRRRFGGKMPYKYDVLAQVFCEDYYNVECDYSEEFSNNKYRPLLDFGGHKECYVIDIKEDILNYKPKDKMAQMRRHCGVTASKVKKSKVKKIFKVPSFEEVKTYCMDRKNSVIPEKFFNYYESNGWKVGKNKMKDWRAAVRTWEGNNFNNNNTPSIECDLPEI